MATKTKPKTSPGTLSAPLSSTSSPSVSRNAKSSGGSTTRPVSRAFSHEEIAARARAIWEREGRPEGRDEPIWYQAERELREQELRTTDDRRFADPDRLTDSDGDPADDVDQRLNEMATPPGERSATSL
jgi:hypothetical protein